MPSHEEIKRRALHDARYHGTRNPFYENSKVYRDAYNSESFFNLNSAAHVKNNKRIQKSTIDMEAIFSLFKPKISSSTIPVPKIEKPYKKRKEKTRPPSRELSLKEKQNSYIILATVSAATIGVGYFGYATLVPAVSKYIEKSDITNAATIKTREAESKDYKALLEDNIYKKLQTRFGKNASAAYIQTVAQEIGPDLKPALSSWRSLYDTKIDGIEGRKTLIAGHSVQQAWKSSYRPKTELEKYKQEVGLKEKDKYHNPLDLPGVDFMAMRIRFTREGLHTEWCTKGYKKYCTKVTYKP